MYHLNKETEIKNINEVEKKWEIERKRRLYRKE